MKTILQIAEALGVDKQRVYRYIKKQGIVEAHQEDGKLYFDEAAEANIYQYFSKNTVSSETHQSISDDVLNDTVFAIIDTLKKELEVKNKQIEELQRENVKLTEQVMEQSAGMLPLIEQAQKLTENAQRLHAMENIPRLQEGRKKGFFGLFERLTGKQDK